MAHKKRKQWPAHRLSYQLFIGDIPKGLMVCHACDVRSCVNPEHLWIGTCADNLADMASKGRAAKGERNGNAKLTNKQVMAILQDDRTLSQIASDYGVDRTNIWQIKSRKTHKHLGGENGR